MMQKNFSHFFLILLFPFLFLSCAKTSYIFEQSVGQIKLVTKARDNKWVLQDSGVSNEVKEKIRRIQKMKRFFEKTWGVDSGEIYSQTTFLDREAVTYLLIRSPHNRVKPLEECFPVQGCFPYLGFFNKSSAEQWKRNRSDEHRHIRPVYAYSTLGYISDPILSSFFRYPRYEMAEMIFHELFHTLFFVEDDVELNENLASFFGRKLATAYFRQEVGAGKKFVQKNRREKRQKRRIAKRISKLRVTLNKRYKKAERGKNDPLTKSESKEILTTFLKEEFRPQIRSLCERLEVQKSACYPLHREWNNASLAAFQTYHSDREKIVSLQKRLKVDFKGLFVYIQKAYRHYRQEGSGEDMRFSEFLFSPETRKKVVMRESS